MRIVWPKVGLFLACLTPLGLLLWDVSRALGGDLSALGADPGEEIVHRLGGWGIRILLITLAISSLARLARRPALIRYRRMVGLFRLPLCIRTSSLLCLPARGWRNCGDPCRFLQASLHHRGWKRTPVAIASCDNLDARRAKETQTQLGETAQAHLSCAYPRSGAHCLVSQGKLC